MMPWPIHCVRCVRNNLQCLWSVEGDGRNQHNMEQLERSEKECVALGRIIDAIQCCPERDLGELLAIVRS